MISRYACISNRHSGWHIIRSFLEDALSFLKYEWLVQHDRLSVMGGLLFGTYYKGSNYRFHDTFAITPDGHLERADYSPYTLPAGTAKDRYDYHAIFRVRPLCLITGDANHASLIEAWSGWLYDNQIVRDDIQHIKTEAYIRQD